MSSGRRALRDWSELGRISNAPTVVSNVLAGAACAGAAGAGAIGDHASRAALLAPLAGAACAVMLYTGGIILNDAADVHVDRLERPHRPIPSGRISRAAAFGATAALFGAAISIAWMLGRNPLLVAAALVVAITLYNALHKRTSWSIGLLGVCRGLLYILGCVAPAEYTVIPVRAAACGLLVGLYTASFSMVARREVEPDANTGLRRAWGGAGAAGVCAAAVILIAGQGIAFAGGLALAAVLLWQMIAFRAATSQRPDLRRAIHAWIAGFCVIDAAVAVNCSRFDVAAMCAACFAATVLAHRRILGT